MERLILTLHLAATGYMVGLIWFVQLVHYPLMKHVGRKDYRLYQTLHMRQTTWAVSPMVLELVFAASLFFLPGVPLSMKVSGALLLVGVWATTALASVPAHARLTQGFDEDAHDNLVRTNWLRTFGWSARLVLAVAMLLGTMK